MMRKMVAFCLASLILALALTGCGGPPVEMRTYKADRFTMPYPQGWERDDESDDEETYVIFSEEELDLYSDEADLMEAPEFAFVLAMHTTDEWADYDPDDLEDLIEDDLEFEALSVSDIKVDGESGKVAEAEGDVEGEDVSMLVAIVDYDDYVMLFAGISPQDDWGSNKKIFDYMLRGIEFIGD
jgi:hypothetical protein